MDTNDEIEMDPNENPAEKDNSTGEVEKVPNVLERAAEDSAATENEVSTKRTITPTADGYWCNLEVEFSWSTDGKHFTCNALRYSASQNDRWKGNLYLDFGSGSNSWGERELTNDDGHQDGKWREIKGGGTIAANSWLAWIKVNYTFDRAGSEVYMSATVNEYYTPPPPTVGLIKNIADSTYTVAGTGVSGCQVRIVRGNTDTTIGAANVLSGAWSTQISYPVNVNKSSIQASQSINGQESARTAVMEIYRASLTFPQPNTLQPSKGLIFRGIGAPGSTVKIVKSPPNHGEVLSAPTNIDNQGIWHAPLTANLLGGPVSVSALVSFADTTDIFTLPVPFKIRTPVVITSPDANSIQNRSFTVSGTGGEVRAIMKIYLDLGNVVVGTLQSVTGNAWSVPVVIPASIPPGEVRLAAEQTLGVPFDRSDYRPFKIRPPQPAKLTVQVDAQGKVTLGGIGHIGATFYLHVVNNGTPFHSFTVTTSPWTVSFPDWLPGTSQIRGRQSVPDGAGQPIYSDYTPENTTVAVPVPPPTLRVSVTTDGTPTFSGTGRNWSGQPASRVEVRLNNASSAIVPIVDVRTDSTWSSTATARWAPGEYPVTATQRFTTLQSGWVQPPVSVIISAPLAVIEKVTPNGLFTKVVGQCWPGAQLTITFSDNPASHPVADTDKNGQWYFQRPTAFRPGRHTVTVTQTFGGQTSNPVSMPFETVVSVLVITPPPDGQTDHLPVLNGTGGIVGFTIRVFDYVTHELLGEALATGDAWSVQLTELDYLTHTVFAIQVLGDLQSLPSSSVAFNVVLFAPRIDFPKNRTSVPRTFTVEGYARAGKGFDRTEVDVYLDGVPHRVYPHFGDGYFKQHFTRPLGPCVLNARQYFKDQESPPGEDVPVTIVPDKVLIETPGAGEAVGRTAVICGFGYPDDEVVVALPGGTELGRTEVQEDGTWFCRIEFPETGTDHSLITEQRNGEFHSGWSEPRPVQRLAGPPTFNEPSEGKWEGVTPGFAGDALANSQVDVVAWYDPDEKYAEALVTNGGRWAGISERNLPAGPQWARAVQVVGGKRSMPADSKRFEVAPPDEPPGLD